MELHYLRTLKVITESDSFSEAAEKLSYTRSTVTFQVRQLEKDFGITLFERIGKKMRLTHEGQAILPYVDTILSSYDQILISGNTEVRKLRIAVSESLLTYRFQPIIQAFREAMPLVDLEIQTGSCYNINQILLDGSSDLAIHYEVGHTEPNIFSKTLTEYPLVFFGSPLLSDAERDFSTPNQKKALSFIVLELDGLYRHAIDQMLSERNITLSSDMVIGSIAAIIRCTKMRLGVSVLPAFAVERELEDGQLLRLDGALAPDSISVLYSYHKNKRLSPAMRCFLKLAEEML
ncbi:HTH-type transcriptional activator CmpR [bioreactor metagenome]|uniref:HTH-type transcriptional activator CmpR n=1 Tax=bioreactor metagenome TaxID=1076179 RepID=A0A644Y6R2_9ZZZZ